MTDSEILREMRRLYHKTIRADMLVVSKEIALQYKDFNISNGFDSFLFANKVVCYKSENRLIILK